MRGMKRYEAHARLDSFHNFESQTVRDRLMHNMGPVNQDVRVIEELIRKAELGMYILT